MMQGEYTLKIPTKPGVKEISCLCYITNVLLPFAFLSGGKQQASNDPMEEGNPYYSGFTVCLFFLQAEINMLWRD